ncbi:EF hand [Limimonas halophila]|uniref:EF hand n=1 Tax=Limimonas halophila TaxID=1082479 RepID=A0A1G7LK44_9PROT|nr:EF-hand domain-containing protein [Limimonas halophila]SDF49897.1 EF hand [Limimonas halophila]
MTHRKKVLRPAVAATLALGLVGGPGVAVAGEHGKKGGGAMPPVFDKADADNDGAVTVEEVRAFADQHVANLDADGNGTISQDEVRAHMKQMHHLRRMARFDQLDADGDGMVSKKEFAKAAPARMGKRGKHGGPMGRGMFKRLDANEDGALQKVEVTSGILRMFARADADGNGSVTREEARQSMQRGHGKRGGMGQGHGKRQGDDKGACNGKRRGGQQ